MRANVNYSSIFPCRNHQEYYADIEVTERAVHPGYDPINFDNDIMLVKLRQPVDGRDIVPVNLNFNSTVPFDDELVKAIGMGTVGEMNSSSLRLKEASVNILSIFACQAQYLNLPNASILKPDIHLCAQAPGQDTCSGDSGGPIFIPGNSSTSDLQVGITSFGEGCARPDFAGVYTRRKFCCFCKFIPCHVCAFSLQTPAVFSNPSF